MATQTLDCMGMRCPQPILKITGMLPQMHPGDVLEATADCETFEDDVRKWCERMNKTLLAVNKSGGITVVQIQF